MSTNVEISLKNWCQFNNFPIFNTESGIPCVVGLKFLLSYRGDKSLKKLCNGQIIFSKMMVMHHIWYKNDDHLMNLLFLTLHEEFLWKLPLKSLFPQGRQPILKKITDGSPQYLLPSKFYSAWCDDDFHVFFQLI